MALNRAFSLFHLCRRSSLPEAERAPLCVAFGPIGCWIDAKGRDAAALLQQQLDA
jgi:hypothetical protein